MNIYEKVLTITLKLQNENIKKTGYNKYAGYNYFELSDIVPVLNKLLLEYKVLMHISYYKEEAKMVLINAENPEESLEYTSPMADISLKGAHAIQNLGAQQTYLRRYFILTVFNVVENDYLDAVQCKEDYEIEQVKADISNICKERLKNGEDKKELSKKYPGLLRLDYLSKKELFDLKKKIS